MGSLFDFVLVDEPAFGFEKGRLKFIIFIGFDPTLLGKTALFSSKVGMGRAKTRNPTRAK